MDERTQRQIARINEISALARASWLGLLAYLAFIFITLLGVQDADFFVPSRQTQLPLVNVEIPTASFFYFAPVLAAALYTYLHLFLIKLWDAIGTAPHKIGADALSDRIHPWLANDLACGMKGNGARPRRPLGWLSTFVTWALVWFAAPAILAGFWWRSMPAHSERLSLLIALSLFVSIIAGSVSWFRAREKLRKRPPALWRRLTRWTLTLGLFLVLTVTTWSRTEGGLEHLAFNVVNQTDTLLRTDRDISSQPETRLLRRCDPADYGTPNSDEPEKPDCFDEYGVRLPSDMVQEARIAAISWIPNDRNVLIRTIQSSLDRWLSEEWTPLISADVSGTALGAAPADWRDYDSARTRYRRDWCKNRDIDADTCEHLRAEWQVATPEHRAARTAWCISLQIPDDACEPRFSALEQDFRDEWSEDRQAALANLTPPAQTGRDLRQADLSNAFLAKADFAGARMEGSNLSGARMEGSVLSGARMEGADLRRARMEGSNLSGARMEGSVLSGARMEGADLSGARMEGADLSGARMEGADLREARMEGAVLIGARMEGAVLWGARMEGAVLREARMEGAVLIGARMEGAVLWGAHTPARPPSLPIFGARQTSGKSYSIK